MAYYGLDTDILANPDKAIKRFIPGESRLTAQDVFIGGPGTGITDDMIGPATRVSGQTAEGTRKALEHYEGDMSSQLQAAIAQNYAPRIDAEMGLPTIQRQQMEIGQAQNSVANALDQKKFKADLDQNAFSNEYNVGNMMGNYKGQNTLQKDNQIIGQTQNEFDNKYKYDALAASMAKGSGGNDLSVSEMNYLDKLDTNDANGKAFSLLNKLANNGKSRTEILNYLNQNFDSMKGADYDALLSRAQKAFTWDKDSDGNWYNTWVSKTPE